MWAMNETLSDEIRLGYIPMIVTIRNLLVRDSDFCTRLNCYISECHIRIITTLFELINHVIVNLSIFWAFSM
jgi:hypothetical protein